MTSKLLLDLQFISRKYILFYDNLYTYLFLLKFNIFFLRFFYLKYIEKNKIMVGDRPLKNKINNISEK